VIEGRGVYDMFLVAVALAVASIPEGLLISMTFILVIGMQRLLKASALTRKLVSAETLGSTTVICSDKTGTLTEGHMAVSHIVIGEKEFELSSPGSRQEGEEAKIVSLAIQIGAMCNNAIIDNPDEPLAKWRFSGTPTEKALLKAAYEAGVDRWELEKKEARLAERQFTSATKFMATLHGKDGGLILYEKGAPEIILGKSASFYHHGELVALNEAHKEKILVNFENLTSAGFRLIAVAFKESGGEFVSEDKVPWGELDKDLIYVGLIALKDPLRPDAKDTIREAREAGIRPVIITGDHKLTALAIGKEIGLSVGREDVVSGDDLDKMSDDELKRRCAKISIYARVSPHHKLRIINALRERGEVVAMAGDGVNDAPALKAADVGIALGNGTDIAKESSDIILLNNNFKVIVAAVQEGRRIFSNLRRVITYLISDSFSEIVIITGSLLFRLPLPILPAQVLWINIVNDGLPHFSLAFEKSTKEMMERKPKGREVPLMSKEMKVMIFGVGLLMNMLIFVVFYRLFKVGMDIERLRTLVFSVLGAKSLLSIFSLRSLSRPIWRMNPFSNYRLVLAVLVSFALLLLSIYLPFFNSLLSTVPLGGGDWLIIISIAGINMVLMEVTKVFFSNKGHKAH
jgi:P-type Ca2+ transporter type 2C